MKKRPGLAHFLRLEIQNETQAINDPDKYKG